jgi:hypothetical protein
MRVVAGFSAAVGMRGLALFKDVKLPTWDNTNDGLGIAIRRKAEEVKAKRKLQRRMTRVARDELVETRVLAAKNLRKVGVQEDEEV